ncbi:MAG: T9SS type A sorting domain-containing protein [Candidatus Methylacidiphilales bacterium]
MKKLLLLLSFIPFTVSAQFSPNLISIYNNPNNLNLILDSNYVPGEYYSVNNYYLDANKIDFNLNNQYDIETNNYLLTKSTQTYYNINSSFKYNQYSSAYFYTNGKISTRNYYRKSIDSINSQLRSIDSFVYKNDLITLIKTNRLGDTTTFSSEGTEYIYDLVGRLVESKPYNYKPIPNYVVSGYLFADSFNVNNKPLLVKNYQVSDTISKVIQSSVINYDSLGRVTNIVFYSHMFQNSPPFKMDSLVHYYREENIYPDSSISYNIANSRLSIGYKTIYNYLPSGKISEILVFNYTNGIPTLTSKSVYTKSFPNSINKVKEQLLEISVFPNPATNKLNIIFEGNIPKNLIANIYDSKGSLIKTETLINNEIAISNLAQGLYLLNIESEGKRYSSKFIKE